MTERYTDGTALLVIDVQNDFAHPDGSLFVSGSPTAITEVNRQIAAAQDAGVPILYTADWHPPSTPHFDTDGGVWPVHCVADTWGAQFHDDLTVDGPVVRKGVDGQDGYSGFSVKDPTTGDVESTALDRLLRERDVTHVVVTGIATDVCVAATVADARRLGYRVTVLADATAGVELQPGDIDASLTAMREQGATVLGDPPRG